MAYYRSAEASEYLAITGAGIDDVNVTKAAWIHPGQKCMTFDITPFNYEIQVQAMSSEKLLFDLPAIFTIGPKVDDIECLKRYAQLLATHKRGSRAMIDLVKGVIEGEARVIAASLTMMQVFMESKTFKDQVFEHVQPDLLQFGLFIYNANVKQVKDVVGHEYFSFLGQKAHETAANRAKVDVAEAQYKGNVGEKEKNALVLQNEAKVNAETSIFQKNRFASAKQAECKIAADTQIYEAQREAEVAENNALLEIKKAHWAMQTRLAEIEAAKRTELRQAELEADVAIRQAAAQAERLRSTMLASAKVEYEANIQTANAELYCKQKEADASLYEKQQEAQALKTATDAMLFSCQRDADARLYKALKEAEGMRAIAEAQGDYVKSMLEAMDGNTKDFTNYLMLDRHVYTNVGSSNANAIQGLNPKINLWTT